MANAGKTFSTKEYEKQMEEKIKNAKRLAFYISKGLKKTKKNVDYDEIQLKINEIKDKLKSLRYYIGLTERKASYISSSKTITKKIKKLIEKYGEIDGSIYNITLDNYIEKVEKDDIKYYRKSDFILHDGNIYDKEKYRIINKKIIPVEEIKDKLYIGIDDNGKETFLKIKDAHEIELPQKTEQCEKCVDYIKMIVMLNGEGILKKFIRNKENIKTLKNIKCERLQTCITYDERSSLIRMFKIGEADDSGLIIKFNNLFEYITCLKIIRETTKNKRLKYVAHYLKNK